METINPETVDALKTPTVATSAQSIANGMRRYLDEALPVGVSIDQVLPEVLEHMGFKSIAAVVSCSSCAEELEVVMRCKRCGREVGGA